MQQPQSPLALKQSPIKKSRKNYGKTDEGKDKLAFAIYLAREVVIKKRNLTVTEKETQKEVILKEFKDFLVRVGITEYKDLPKVTCNYLDRISELTKTSIDIISTGPERNETIVLKNPFV